MESKVNKDMFFKQNEEIMQKELNDINVSYQYTRDDNTHL